MFVYEIDSVKNLNTQSSKQIEFFDPKLAEQSAGNATRRPDSGVPTEAFQINDDELASSDTGEYQLQVPPVILSFSEPAYTTRKPYDGRRRTRAGKGTEEINLTGDAHTEVSTDEPTIRGEIPSGVFDGVDDQSDDAHLYLHRFEAFVLMVDHLEANGCEVLSGQIRKLPVLQGHSKYRLPDGNPRCVVYRVLKYEHQIYALVEIDTTDKEKRLSTLLIRQPNDVYDWNSKVEELCQLLVKKSLCWPTKKLDREFSEGYKRIPHQRTPDHNKLILDSASVEQWAKRVLGALF